MKDRIGNIDELYPVRFDTDGMPLCRGCGKKLPGKHRRWCSTECSDSAMIKCYPGTARYHVWKRDKGICAKCGLDCERLENIVRKCKKYHWLKKEWNRHPKILDAIQKKYPWTAYLINRSFWEAHHKHAVKDGGGGCGLDNYETLCYGCHTKTFGKKKEVVQEELKFVEVDTPLGEQYGGE